MNAPFIIQAHHAWKSFLFFFFFFKILSELILKWPMASGRIAKQRPFSVILSPNFLVHRAYAPRFIFGYTMKKKIMFLFVLSKQGFQKIVWIAEGMPPSFRIQLVRQWNLNSWSLTNIGSWSLTNIGSAPFRIGTPGSKTKHEN